MSHRGGKKFLPPVFASNSWKCRFGGNISLLCRECPALTDAATEEKRQSFEELQKRRREHHIKIAPWSISISMVSASDRWDTTNHLPIPWSPWQGNPTAKTAGVEGAKSPLQRARWFAVEHLTLCPTNIQCAPSPATGMIGFQTRRGLSSFQLFLHHFKCIISSHFQTYSKTLNHFWISIRTKVPAANGSGGNKSGWRPFWSQHQWPRDPTRPTTRSIWFWWTNWKTSIPTQERIRQLLMSLGNKVQLQLQMIGVESNCWKKTLEVSQIFTLCT